MTAAVAVAMAQGEEHVSTTTNSMLTESDTQPAEHRIHFSKCEIWSEVVSDLPNFPSSAGPSPPLSSQARPHTRTTPATSPAASTSP